MGFQKIDLLHHPDLWHILRVEGHTQSTQGFKRFKAKGSSIRSILTVPYWVRAENLAPRYDVSVRTLKTWVKMGRLPARKLSHNLLLFSPSQTDPALGLPYQPRPDPNLLDPDADLYLDGKSGYALCSLLVSFRILGRIHSVSERQLSRWQKLKIFKSHCRRPGTARFQPEEVELGLSQLNLIADYQPTGTDVEEDLEL